MRRRIPLKLMIWRIWWRNKMIKIIIKSTGFFIDRPRVDELLFPNDTLLLDKKDQKVYLGDLTNDEILRWFETEKLQETQLKDRVISLNVERINDHNH